MLMGIGLATGSIAAAGAGAFVKVPPPPGSNDARCKPARGSGQHVVLLHGTNSDRYVNWLYVTPRLREAGHCVWTVQLQNRGRAPVATQSLRLRRFVRWVRGETGARRVSLIGHSLGGIVGRHYIRFRGGKREVDDLISLGTPHKGYVSTPESKPVDDLYNTDCPSCREQAAGSAFLRRLNRGDMSPGKVSYTQIGTVHDEVIGDYRHAFITPGPRVTNVLLQDRCPDHFVEHLGLAADDLVIQWIRHALSRRGPASPRAPVSCPPV